MRSTRARLTVTALVLAALVAAALVALAVRTDADVRSGEFSLEVNIDETSVDVGEPFVATLAVVHDGGTTYKAAQWDLDYDEVFINVVEIEPDVAAETNCTPRSNDGTRVLAGCIQIISGPGSLTYSGPAWHVTFTCFIGGRVDFNLQNHPAVTFVRGGSNGNVTLPSHIHGDSINCNGPTATPRPPTATPTITRTHTPTQTPGGPTPTVTPTDVPGVYPPPDGNCEMTSSATTAVPESTVDLTLTVRDAAGTVVRDAWVSFSIASQPGTDARLTQIDDQTNGDGQARAQLLVGTTPGEIRVTSECASATIVVEG
jgi:hypothetical protein